MFSEKAAYVTSGTLCDISQIILTLMWHLKEAFEEFLVMAGEDDVVIADGVGKEIIGLGFVGKLDHLLCAAEVWLLLIAD